MVTEDELFSVVKKHISPDTEYGEHNDVDGYSIALEVKELVKAAAIKAIQNRATSDEIFVANAIDAIQAI